MKLSQLLETTIPCALKKSLLLTLGLSTLTLVSGWFEASAAGPILNIDFTSSSGSKTGPAAVGLSPSDFWNRSITTGNAGTVTFNNLTWSDGTASSVDLTVQNAPGLWGNGVTDDPMYQDYVYSFNAGQVTLTLSGFPNNTYDLYVYGHSPADEGNGLFQLKKNGTQIGYKGTTIWGHNWASTNWTEGEQYIVFRNIQAGQGDVLELDVLPVESFPIIAGIQLVPQGAITIPPPAIQRLINVDAGQNAGPKVGLAAVGQTGSDVWNTYQQPSSTYGVLQNLVYADSTASQVGLIVQNAPGFWGIQSPPAPIDPMYDQFVYPFDGGSVSVSVTNLPNGVYDLYIYSHAGDDGANGVIHLNCGSVDYGIRGTSIWGNKWASANWEDGQQYVAFRKVVVSDGNSVQFTISAYQETYAYLNGIQIIQRPDDSDGDGLPDWWELKYFGNLDQGPNGDYDNDGLTNLQEYQHGTNPTLSDTDGDGLSDSEELSIYIDTSNPGLGFLDPTKADTGNTGVPDGQKDSDHDGISNLLELRNFGSSPTNAHTFNGSKNDAEYFFTARPSDPTTMASLNIQNLGNNLLGFTISGAFANAQYDLYFVNNLLAQRWQWRRVYSGIQCDNAGSAMFQLKEPDPNQGFFVILSAEDTDGDGLTDGYETWFNYNGRKTVIGNPDTDGDLMHDDWEVEYGIDPTSAAGNDGAGGNPDGDMFSNFTESQNYSPFDGSYDPLKVYNTSANRPVVSVFADNPNPSCDTTTITIYRFAGIAGDYSQPLTVYYAPGGTLSFDEGQYSLNPTPAGLPRIYSAQIPANSQGVQVTVSAPGVSPNNGDVQKVVIALTPYAVAPDPQVSDPSSWQYVTDWPNNRATITFDNENLRPTAFGQGVQTCRNNPIQITLQGSGACGQNLTFNIATPPSHGSLGLITPQPPNSALVTYTPNSPFCGQDSFTFTVSDGVRVSAPATVTVDVGDPNPQACFQNVMTGVRKSIALTLSGSESCTDPALTYAIVSGQGPFHGVLSGTPPNLTYTPNTSPDFAGQDQFQFTVGDCIWNSQPATVTIYVTPGPVLSAQCRPLSIVLTWDMTTIIQLFGFDLENAGFKVYRSTVSGGPYTLLTPTPLPTGSSSYIDTSVTPGTSYYYAVTFLHTDSDCHGNATTFESPYSNEVGPISTCCNVVGSGLWVDKGPTPLQLAQYIMGPSVNLSNAKYTGSADARGIFGGGSTVGLNGRQFPIDHGVILASGDINDAIGPNNNSGSGLDLGEPGDSDLDTLVGGSGTHDAAVLEFDFVSTNSFQLQIQFVFGSEEYPEYIGPFNDPVGIFINTTDIALVPNTALPVSVNNINGGCVLDAAGHSDPATNPQYYVDNHDPGFSSLPAYAASTPVYNLQYDGFTTLLTAQTNISANVVYHAKIAVADFSDSIYDSGVFLKTQSFPCP